MIDLLTGDALQILKTLPDAHFHCCVTSPPYYGLRDYGTGLWRGGDPACGHSPADTDGKRGLGASGLEGSLSCTGHRQEGYGARCGRCGAVRDDRQIGFEATCPEYIDAVVAVMDEVWRVLRPDGNLFLDLGDRYTDRIAHGRRRGNKLFLPHRIAIAMQDQSTMLSTSHHGVA